MPTDHSLVVSITDHTGPGARSVERNLSRVAGSARGLERTMGGTSRAVAGAAGSMRGLASAAVAVGTAMATSKLVGYADAWKIVTSLLKQVTTTTEELRRAQEDVFAVARETRSEFDATANLYARLTRSTRSLHASQAQVLTATRAISEAMAVSGANAAEASAAITQLGQGLASGALRGDELRSVMEQAPRLARAIAEGLDVDIGKLRELGAAGELTAARVFGAIQRESAKIHTEFEQTSSTVGQALTGVANSSERLVGRLDAQTDASERVADALSVFSGWLDKQVPETAKAKTPSAARLAGQADPSRPYREALATAEAGLVGMLFGRTAAQRLLYQAAGGFMAEDKGALARMTRGRTMGIGGPDDTADFRRDAYMRAVASYATTVRGTRESAPAELSAEMKRMLSQWDAYLRRATERSIEPSVVDMAYQQRALTLAPAVPAQGGLPATGGRGRLSGDALVWFGGAVDETAKRVGQLTDAFSGLSPELDNVLDAATRGTQAVQMAMAGDPLGAAITGIGAVLRLFGKTKDSAAELARALERSTRAARDNAREVAGIARGLPGQASGDLQSALLAPIIDIYEGLKKQQDLQWFVDQYGQYGEAMAEAESVRLTRLLAHGQEMRDAVAAAGFDWDFWTTATTDILGTNDVAELTSMAFENLTDTLEDSADAAGKLVAAEERAIKSRFAAQTIVAQAQFAQRVSRAGGDVYLKQQAYADFQRTVASILGSESLALQRVGRAPGATAAASPAAEAASKVVTSAGDVVEIEQAGIEDFGVSGWSDVIDMSAVFGPGFEKIPVRWDAALRMTGPRPIYNFHEGVVWSDVIDAGYLSRGDDARKIPVRWDRALRMTGPRPIYNFHEGITWADVIDAGYLSRGAERRKIPVRWDAALRMVGGLSIADWRDVIVTAGPEGETATRVAVRASDVFRLLPAEIASWADVFRVGAYDPDGPGGAARVPVSAADVVALSPMRVQLAAYAGTHAGASLLAIDVGEMNIDLDALYKLGRVRVYPARVRLSDIIDVDGSGFVDLIVKAVQNARNNRRL